MDNIKTILLTGATGYLGSKLVESFINEGFSVIILKRRNSSVERIQPFLSSIKYFDLDEDGLDSAFKENLIDCVVHTAASYGRKGESLSELFDANLGFPIRLLEKCLDFKVKCFINTGTSLPANLNIYALSKHQFIDVLKLYQGSIKVVNIELEYFYGPGDDNSKFITYIIGKLFSGSESIDLSEGLQLRDFIYIKDVVNAYLTIIKHLSQFQEYTNISVGSGTAYKLRDIVTKIKSYMKSNTNLNFGALPMRVGEVMHSEANIQFLNNLGWTPDYDLDKGLIETINTEKTSKA